VASAGYASVNAFMMSYPAAILGTVEGSRETDWCRIRVVSVLAAARLCACLVGS